MRPGDRHRGCLDAREHDRHRLVVSGTNDYTRYDAATRTRHWLTPPEIARERGIRTGKVLEWIHSGELEAINHASSRVGSPRWRVSREALDRFDAARSNRAGLIGAGGQADRARRRRCSSPHVEEFFS